MLDSSQITNCDNFNILLFFKLGSFITDGMVAQHPGVQLALMNTGGIRDGLPARTYSPVDLSISRPPSDASLTAGPWDLVFGDPYTVLPFGNAVAIIDISASNLWAALENSVSKIPGENQERRYPQISGFTFSYLATAPVGARIQKVTIAGVDVPRDGTTVYSMATIDYIVGGGDGYSMFQGLTPNIQGLSADVLIASIEASGALTTVPMNYQRITALNSAPQVAPTMAPAGQPSPVGPTIAPTGQLSSDVSKAASSFAVSCITLFIISFIL